MDKTQIRTLQAAGYAIEAIPTTPQPKMTFWRKDKHVGENNQVVEGQAWIEMPNLPADPDSLKRYLARGFVPIKPKEVEATENTCSICGKACNGAFGLSSHMKAHKNETNKEEIK